VGRDDGDARQVDVLADALRAAPRRRAGASARGRPLTSARDARVSALVVHARENLVILADLLGATRSTH